MGDKGYRGYSKPNQKKNAFNNVESWRKPWVNKKYIIPIQTF